MLFELNAACCIGAGCVGWYAILRHLLDYRKPWDQRHVVRILLMMPLFSLNAYSHLYWPQLAAKLIGLICDLYEAFVIYTFYTYLTSFLGGERAIILDSTGKAPLRVWGLQIDVSDPQIFVWMKRCIIQFCYFRPLVAVLAVLCSNWRFGSIAVTLGYNVSITLALNALMTFYICLRQELEPYNVILKFFSIKSVVFFSYWQGLAVALCGWVIPLIAEHKNTIKYTLLCIEAVPIAVLHYKAFPTSDYTATMKFGFARMRFSAAVKDVFGVKDLYLDFKHTFGRGKYRIRDFDSVESVLDHPKSHMRAKRLAAGLRYREGGSKKHWLPQSSIKYMHSNSRTYGSIVEPPNAPNAPNAPNEPEVAEPYTLSTTNPEIFTNTDCTEDDELWEQARATYGDYNCPVITVRPCGSP